jgi:hypothetical protein
METYHCLIAQWIGFMMLDMKFKSVLKVYFDEIGDERTPSSAASS